MTRCHRLFGLAVIIGTVLPIYFLGVTLNQRRYAGDITEELRYFPSGQMLEVASMGFDTLVADLLWLRGIQYYGEHHRSDKDYPLAEHIYSVITDLDPHFVGAYRFGAFVLAQDVGRPGAGIELLRKGIRSNPDSWQLPFDLGFMYFVEMEDNARAAHFFKFASRFEDAPAVVKRFSAFAYKRAGRTDVAKALWEEIYRSSDNDVMRESAEYALRNIYLDEALAVLNGLVDRFTCEKSRPPADLADLVESGLAREIPAEPFGGRYFLDPPTLQVLSTTRVTAEAERTRGYLDRLVKRYSEKTGHYPPSLADLVEEGLVSEVPVVAGARVIYSPRSGTVRYVFAWDETS